MGHVRRTVLAITCRTRRLTCGAISRKLPLRVYWPESGLARTNGVISIELFRPAHLNIRRLAVYLHSGCARDCNLHDGLLSGMCGWTEPIDSHGPRRSRP